MASTPNQLSLARFASHIYGFGGPERSTRAPEPKPGKRLVYSCEREITCLSQLQHPLGRLNSSYYDTSAHVPSHHVIIGGKNYLKLLALNADQTAVVTDVNMVDASLQARIAPHKLFNVNTIKCYGDMVACGLTSGSVAVFQVNGNGKARLAHRLDDHKRVINSLDFADLEQVLLSGLQDGTVRLWDLRTYLPKPVLRLQSLQHSDPVRACQYSQHSRVRGKMTVLSVHDLGALCKFDLRFPGSSGAALPERRWTYHTGPALSLHIHPTSERVITAGRDRKIAVWNYAESAANLAPEVALSTYGPVMKIRWCEADDEREAWDLDDTPSTTHDFACLFLNDDPTIAVYSLRRKYIAKEIITHPKPVQNFIWARSRERKLWTITKANVFGSYSLAHDECVSRPLETLPTAAADWSGHANMAFVSQNSSDFWMLQDDDPEPEEEHEHHSAVTLDSLQLYGKSLDVFGKYKSGLPKDRPPLIRLATHNPMAKLPSPGPQRMLETLGGIGLLLLRPTMVRNPSQSTQDLGSLASLLVLAPNRRGLAAPSPYLVTAPVPIPLNDDMVFEELANEYHVALPDGFSLADVCHMNARVAASVHRFRDCQVWRMLAVLLDQEQCAPFLEEMSLNEEEPLSKSPDDAKSVLSDLGNFVGSYNSNSTLTTNYGSVPRRSGSNSSVSNMALLSSSKELSKGGHSLQDFRSSAGSLLDGLMPILSGYLANVPGGSPAMSRSNSALAEKNRPFMRPQSLHGHSLISEHAIAPDEDDDESSGKSTHRSSHPASAIDIRKGQGTLSPHRAISPDFLSDASPLHYHSGGRRQSTSGKQAWAIPGSSQDLDNENLHILNNAASLSLGYMAGGDSRLGNGGYSHTSRPTSSFLSVRTSPMAVAHGFGSRSSFNRANFNRSATNLLERVDESSVHSKEPHASELTKAIHGTKQESDESEYLSLDKPWSTINMLAKAVSYAMEQGDVIMCATLTLLFYGPFRKQFVAKVMSKNSSLECLGMYVDALRKRKLFTNAVNVVKDAPSDLKYELSVYASKDVDLRFYCCWCQKLLVNETTKAKYTKQPDNFGYWYCDECSRKQLNCVYCNEPCKGLTVVVSLKCGHRGHFGCLQEWFVVDEHAECPGGCEEVD